MPIGSLRRSAFEEISVSPLVKCIAVVRVLAFGCSAEATYDYVFIGEDTILEAVRRFTKAVLEIFRPEYLREPHDEDAERLLGSINFASFFGFLTLIMIGMCCRDHHCSLGVLLKMLVLTTMFSMIVSTG